MKKKNRPPGHRIRPAIVLTGSLWAQVPDARVLGAPQLRLQNQPQKPHAATVAL